jgi:hypothetical protein
LQGLFGPTITHVHIDAENLANLDLIFLLSSISRTCPGIEELRVDPVEPNGEDHVPALSQLICELSHLRALSTGRTLLPPEVIIHLSKLTNFISFNTVQIPPDIGLFTTNDGHFPSLRRFGFYSQSWSTAMAVMGSMSCPFEILSVGAAGESEPLSALGGFVASISAPHLVSSLTSLHLKGSLRMIDMHDRSVYETLLPLFSLRALHSMTLQIPVVCALLNDSWLECAAMAWPFLQTLSLGDVPSPLMTLAGLLPLVKHCPALNTLWLTLNARPVHPALFRARHQSPR